MSQCTACGKVFPDEELVVIDGMRMCPECQKALNLDEITDEDDELEDVDYGDGNDTEEDSDDDSDNVLDEVDDGDGNDTEEDSDGDSDDDSDDVLDEVVDGPGDTERLQPGQEMRETRDGKVFVLRDDDSVPPRKVVTEPVEDEEDEEDEEPVVADPEPEPEPTPVVVPVSPVKPEPFIDPEPEPEKKRHVLKRRREPKKKKEPEPKKDKYADLDPDCFKARWHRSMLMAFHGYVILRTLSRDSKTGDFIRTSEIMPYSELPENAVQCTGEKKIYCLDTIKDSQWYIETHSDLGMDCYES